VGRRATGLSRAMVWESADAVVRAVTRLYPDVRFDLDGQREASVAIERQDLDEILGNLVENAAKYGGGSVFITIDAVPTDPKFCDIWVEDDGMGIPEAERERIFDRGARLDTGKPGTGWAWPSCATWPNSMAAPSPWAKAKTSAGCSPPCVCPARNKDA
jgi:signal transduction histidine kinase